MTREKEAGITFISLIYKVQFALPLQEAWAGGILNFDFLNRLRLFGYVVDTSTQLSIPSDSTNQNQTKLGINGYQMQPESNGIYIHKG